ncbi:MAG: hypothetical protein NZ524_07505 [Thiobacillaceae bacterium]|nr:hypothetical protein [Thiobacillaceae bacterium]
MTELLEQRRRLLARKLAAIDRLRELLHYSRNRLPYPLSSIDRLPPEPLESVSALIERFGKLQDLLGHAMREVVLLSGEPATDMNDVLSRMEKLGVLDSADDWRALRALRNQAAHDDDLDDGAKTAFVNTLAAKAEMLTQTAARLTDYAYAKLDLPRITA